MLPRIALARPSQPFPPAALALVALAFILPGLAGHDLWKSHDAIGLGLVHEMARSGDLVVPRLAGVAWLNDPPLYHWAALAFGAALDSILEFHAAARLASGAFLLAAFWLIYRAAGQWADRTAAVAAMPEADRALYTDIPAWVTGAYAIAVFGGTIASVALLLRKAWAVPAFIVSLAAIVVQMGHALFVSELLNVKGPSAAVLPIVIVAIDTSVLLAIFNAEPGARDWLDVLIRAAVTRQTIETGSMYGSPFCVCRQDR